MTSSVLITGAGTGIGLETALYLAERGFLVYASVPDLSQQEKVDTGAEERGVSLRVLQLDVTDQQSVQAAVDTVIEETDGIYGLVNNAGKGLRVCRRVDPGEPAQDSPAEAADLRQRLALSGCLL